MTGKAKGGRGKKAQNPYERFTVTVPPELRVWLDGEAQRQGVTRSEALTLLLTEARDGKNGVTSKPAAPVVLPGTPELFPAMGQTEKPAPAARKILTPRATPKPTTPAAPGAPGPAVTPPSADQMQVTGSKLTTPQAMICAGLQLPGAVAEYDFYERRWLVGFAGAPAKQADLEELASMGVLVNVGTGDDLNAVYRLAPPVKPENPNRRRVRPDDQSKRRKRRR